VTGLFITLEGPDGAGKTTQVKKIANWLLEQGLPHLVTREPGGTSISDAIRTILLNPENEEMQYQTEVLLYAASRAQHVREKIIPALDKNMIVLCDRFVDASMAYQGHGLEMPLTEIESINNYATGGLAPHRTYLIDLPPDVGRQRLEARMGTQAAPQLDRIEQKQISYHQRVREGFRRIYNDNTDRILLIDGVQGEEDIFQVIKADLERLVQDLKIKL
jgi:dTMP kinase